MFWKVLCSWLGFSSQGLGKLNFCQILVWDWSLLLICFGCWPLVAKGTCIKGRFHDVHALFHVVVHSVHIKCLIKCLLGIFLLVWTLMSTKLWDFSCFLIRNMFGLLVVYLTYLAPHVHFPCIGHALHIATSCTHLCYPCHTLVYTLFLHPSMSYLPYALQHLFCLLFELHFSFVLHPSCIILLVHTFISCPFFLLDPFVYSCQKGGEYTLEQYAREFCYFYMTLVHILRGRNSISCAHLQGERYSIREMHIPRGRRHCVNKKTLFCLFFFMVVFLFALQCFELCLVYILFVLIASCLCVSHLFMTVLVYDQVAHMFHIMFT